MDLPVFGTVLAMLVQGALALGLMWRLGFVRVPMIMRGDVPLRDIATSRAGWPEPERAVSNAVDNQFQLPLLFYLGCGLSLFMSPSWLTLGLAWLFVVSRYVHAAIHITDNNVVRRFWAFSVGLVALTLFWLVLAAQVLVVAFAVSRGAL
jgi:hypothetical protein